ncbi:MAG: DNA repair protein RadC [Candidatus Eisenbacteria bacterium]|nr:DNA repair protein RadC [Candidatus Eisenbacteria bacterium]
MARRRRVCYLVAEDLPRSAPPPRGAPRSLSDLELVALVLGEGSTEDQPIARAARLLDGGPAAVLQRLTPRRIRSLAGERGGTRICAALELGRRILQGTGCGVLSSPKHVLEYARAYAGAQKEHFLVIHLNARHLPRRLEVVSVGTLSASLVHPREVFREAINQGSAGLILAHNHPSGDPSPSADDIEITSRLARVGELVGIEVIDHVILTSERYFSFREEGLLAPPPPRPDAPRERPIQA